MTKRSRPSRRRMSAAKLSTRALERVRQDHLKFLCSSWLDCIGLSDELVAHRSNDPMDEIERLHAVLEVATSLFIKNAPALDEFVGLLEHLGKRRRRR